MTGTLKALSAAVNQQLTAVLAEPSGASLIGWDNDNIADFFTNHVDKQVASVAELRTVDPTVYKQVYRQGYSTPGDGGHAGYVYVPTGTPPADNGATYVAALGGLGYWLALLPTYIVPELFGCVGDYNTTTKTGTDNTVNMRAMFNWASTVGTEIQLQGGRKYATDTIYLYYDAVKNPGYAAKPGRVKVVGGAGGIATGAQEAQGSAFVHIDGSAARLFESIGSFSIANPGDGGSQMYFETVNFIGGSLTTDVWYMQDCQGQIAFDNLTFQVANPAGNGVTECTTWEAIYNNILIRGQATGDGTWTGIGLNIISDDSGGQVNMKQYNNVDVYKMGYGIIIGRSNSALPDGGTGTFGPLVFIGGQVSLSDYHNIWFQGGAYNVVTIGQQSEQARYNGIRIDSNGQSDLPRNIKIINPYLTYCGKIADGSDNEFGIYIGDGVQVTVDQPLFQNAYSGIRINAVTALDCQILKPVFRTVGTYGQASGRGISFTGAYTPANRIKIVDPKFNYNFATNVDDANNVWFASQQRYASTAGNLATPSIAMGAGVNGGQASYVLNLNNTVATTVTNILDPEMYQTLLLTFGNTLTTIQSNGNIYLQGGENFTPVNSQQTLTLYYNGVWKEIGRSSPPAINPLSIASNLAVPDITSHTAPTNVVVFNNTVATAVTGMTSGVQYQTLTVTFGNLNTSFAPSSTMVLAGSVPFIPASTSAVLTLYYDGSVWKEVSRSGGIANGLVRTSATAVPLTGTTTATPMATVQIPARAMGINGYIEVDMTWSWTNSANAKAMTVTFGGSTFMTDSVSATGTSSGRFRGKLQNRGSTGSQVGPAAANPGSGTNGSGVITTTVDTTVAQNVVISGTLGLATETLQLEQYTVNVVYA